MPPSTTVSNSATPLPRLKAAIAAAVLGVLLMMGAVVTFLLIALRVWDNQGSFDATIQSCLIGGAGFLQRKLQDFEMKEEDIDKIIDR